MSSVYFIYNCQPSLFPVNITFGSHHFTVKCSVLLLPVNFNCQCLLSLSLVNVTSYLSPVTITCHCHLSLSTDIATYFNCQCYLCVFITCNCLYCHFCPLLTYLLTLAICRGVFAPKNN